MSETAPVLDLSRHRDARALLLGSVAYTEAVQAGKSGPELLAILIGLFRIIEIAARPHRPLAPSAPHPTPNSSSAAGRHAPSGARSGALVERLQRDLAVARAVIAWSSTELQMLLNYADDLPEEVAEHVAALEEGLSSTLLSLDARRCIDCGCTDDSACEGGCWWVSRDPPRCSSCAGGAH